MKRTVFYIGAISSSVLTLCACTTFLEVKPDQSLAVPNTLRDLQAMMDFETAMNTSYPDAGDIASDYYYMEDADWAARTEEVRELYTWQPKAERNQWEQNYTRVNYCNIVLGAVDQAELGGLTEVDRNSVKGTALFFRGFTFLQLANLYAPPYQRSGNDALLGIPLRIEADVNIKTTRATLAETYAQIVNDFRSAADLLPRAVVSATRPNKAAAYAALARVYLIMGDYKQAGEMADISLSLSDGLMDFNELDPQAAAPIPLLNKETLLYAEMIGTASVFLQGRAKLAPIIANLYDGETDLRKRVYYIINPDGTYSFKGTYSRNAALLFAGLATDEMYLIKSESAIRQGNHEEALAAINYLLSHRISKGSFNPVDIDKPAELLEFILNERKKELAFRCGIYWSDVRRLYAIEGVEYTMIRNIGDERYRLPSGDPRTTLLIPEIVIQESGIKQNYR